MVLGGPVLIEAVFPMPPPGKRRSCFEQSTNLFFSLRSDPAMLAHLRFVGFKQPLGGGAHFVVEDERSVYDQTSRVEARPDWTRVTKASYWGMYPDSNPNARFDNDQFQVLYDIVATFHERGRQPSCNQIMAIMMAIEGLWRNGKATETEDERFQRIAERIFGVKGLRVSDSKP